jgi:diadenosine tetraphosphate (Ap4A) HIT family hydrolase
MDADWILWENKDFVVKTLKNPHISLEEGCHIVIFTKEKLEKSWDNPELACKGFELAIKVSKIVVDEKIADWVNIQNNQNWGLLPGGKLFFHIHIYGRRKSGKTWSQPVEIPKLPNTFKNKPMSERERKILTAKFKENLD